MTDSPTDMSSGIEVKYEARMGTKHADCPVCGGKSSLITRKIAIEDHKAVITNQWFDRRLREGSHIFYEGDRIDGINFLVRNHRICTKCLFVTSCEDKEELESILTIKAVKSLRSGRGRRLAAIRTILGTKHGDNLDSILHFEDHLKKRRTDERIFSSEGRKRFLNLNLRQTLVKLCIQHLISPNDGEVVQNIVSKLFTNGIQCVYEILFDLPMSIDVIRVIHSIENLCLNRIISANNEFTFTSQNIPPNLDDVKQFREVFKQSREDLLTLYHHLFSTMANMLTLSELVTEDERNQMLEMALIFAELSMNHEDRHFVTKKEKERERNRAESPAKSRNFRKGRQVSQNHPPETAAIIENEVEIDPRRVSHNKEILTYIILKLQKLLDKPLDEKLRDRAMHVIQNNDIYSFQGVCGSIGGKLEELLKDFF